MRIILKIGGSILYEDEEISLSMLQQWIPTIQNIMKMGHIIGIVVGGGIPARKFGKIAKKLGANAAYQDLIGIEATRQNARLLIAGLPEAYPHPPLNYQELIALIPIHPLVITGGFQPGQSTNAVAAIFAEHLGADFLFNFSNVKKVYNKDPSLHSDAKPFDELKYDDLFSIIRQNEQSPGKYALFDTLGLEIVKRSKIPLVFLDGRSPQLLIDVLNGESHGTVVK